MVTVTVSIDCLAFDGWPLVAVLAVLMTSSPALRGLARGSVLLLLLYGCSSASRWAPRH